ncbi:hypothetical protein [Cyclobacterium amurskyense]|uniref:Outer membrane protein beta-barrel domain-containing protein n=1 Tax=Cyclobacterium amurskyense TaxID=320787 RepID=A0A0H4PAV2_9BACT|nr:hypothetical protein [Cyclobacterium amurskyense]AKP51334.1 hypothetical protein CA2015_1907 [Cyclobacterium amurskyense]|tara:strand:- start:28992 stop:29621 length:630 start_codon:yes stop_codon:yes gene_type:complete
MNRIVFAAAFFIATGITAIAQHNAENYSVKGTKIFGLGTSLNNTRYLQGNNDFYKELFFDYGLGEFISTGVFVGYQKRQYSFLSVMGSDSKVLYYDQNFIPIGLRATVHLTSFLSNQLQVHLKPEKWDVYIRYYTGVTLNTVDDKFDRSNGHLPEDQVNYMLYRTNEDLNYAAGLLTGVGFYPAKNFGFFFEGGYGPMGNFNVGIVGRY